MSTPYQVIFDKFVMLLKNDNQFFSYSGLSEEEVYDLVQEHLNSLLDRAVNYIYEFGNPDIDLFDKDDDAQVMNVDLVNQEIRLLSSLMYTCYSQEQKNRINALSITFRSQELNVFSPSQERKTTMDLITSLETDSEDAIQNYLSRDRLTWEYKSIYGSASQ